MGEEADVAILIRSGTPLLFVETHEEGRAVDLFRRVVTQVWRPLYQWTVTEGLVRLDLDVADFGKQHESPKSVLEHIKRAQEDAIYLLMDFHPYLSDPVNERLLREITLDTAKHHRSVVLISPDLELPDSLKRIGSRVKISMPDAEALQNLVQEEAFRWSRHNEGRRVKVSRKSMDILVRNLTGLTLKDARTLTRKAIYNDGAIQDCDLPRVMQAKFELLNRGGVLAFEYETAEFADVAGLDVLKAWVARRQPAMAEAIPGLDPPKGLLLLGVQGCGKSLAAKAIAGGFGVPLLRLDFGTLYNKYHGETERNLRESLDAATLMAPCVLWIDEIEKGLSVGESDGGTSQRVLGTLLTWMAERQSRIFVVATANDVSTLPPELLRKGRFDEIFFVDLPPADVRASILDIHLRRREIDPAEFGLEELAAESDGFSGAELEQAVVSSLYAAHAGDVPLATEHIRQELRATRPLSVIMAEKVAELRRWAASRTVSAH